jgi:prepilin-type N-terminal cleavage/methylation domain-containing protein
MSRQPKTQMQLPITAANNNGLTLIECLVAIAVIGLTAAVMAPVMVFSVATRLQNQRAEQALQIAQGEVDKVRLMVERGGDFSSQLNAYPSTTTAIAATGAPTLASTSFSSTTPTVAKLVNIDSDAENEFAVQVFRSPGRTPAGSTVPVAFELGVRVYDYLAWQRQGGTLLTDEAALSFTNGDGQRGNRPLSVIYTTMFKGDRDNALCEYRQHLNSTASTTGLNCT